MTQTDDVGGAIRFRRVKSLLSEIRPDESDHCPHHSRDPAIGFGDRDAPVSVNAISEMSQISAPARDAAPARLAWKPPGATAVTAARPAGMEWPTLLLPQL